VATVVSLVKLKRLEERGKTGGEGEKTSTTLYPEMTFVPCQRHKTWFTK
jgi:hypothetical protein